MHGKLANYRYEIAILMAFAASRLVFAVLGGRFTVDFNLIQLIDPVLLQGNFLESIYYMHYQPPLFNLFVGAVINFFPENFSLVFNVIYLIVGITFHLILWRCFLLLNVNRRLSLCLVLLVVIIPSSLLWENVLVYTYPTALFLLLSGFFYFRWQRNDNISDAIGLVVFCTLVVATRSFFHPVWLVVVLGFAIITCRPSWRLVAALALIPLIVVGGWTLKNSMAFSTGAGTSYLGYNFFSMALRDANIEQPEKVERLISEGVLSPLASAPWMRGGPNILEYAEGYARPPKLGIPILDDKYKSDGTWNFNYLGLAIYLRALESDGLKALVHFPKLYLRTMRNGIWYFIQPYWNYFQFRQSPGIAMPLERAGIFQIDHFSGLEGHVDPCFSAKCLIRSPWIYVIATFIAAILFGGVLATKVFFAILRSPLRHRVGGRELGITFMVMTIVYVFLISLLIMPSENNRARFLIHPFSWLIFGVLIQTALPIVSRMVNPRFREIKNDD